MLHLVLKEYTQPVHNALEHKLLFLIRSLKDKDDYIGLLRLLYGYYHALEVVLDKYISAQDMPDYVMRRKSQSLVEDIRQLTSRTYDMLLCEELPVVNSYAAALGCMYVLEGSTLGGRIIASIIEKKLSLKEGLSFFQGYKERGSIMWESFTAYLQQPFSDAEKRELLGAAHDTFITFKLWIESNESDKL